MSRALIDNGDWFEYKIPFRHFRAENVLDAETYSRISKNFVAVQHGDIKGKNGDVYRLEKLSQNYDALMLGMNEELKNLFEPFFSVDFLTSIAEFLKVPFNFEIDGGLHSNLVNSGTGWIHNDFCNCWFDKNFVREGNLTFPRRDMCDYFTGQQYSEKAKPVKFVRAATLIFYLCNGDWTTGDGGETALYGASQLSDNTIVDLVAPKDNSLILFECSPHSYHRFITNRNKTRNSLILWLHSTPEFSASKWPNAIN